MCQCFEIGSDGDFNSAWAGSRNICRPCIPSGSALRSTTTRQTSNPSVVSVLEMDGAGIIYRAAFVWKLKEPDVVREKIRAILRVIANRPGGRARALAVDATNEKYFAEDLRRRLRAEVPVLLVVSSERVDGPIEKPTNWKEYLGDQYIGFLEDNHLTLPPGCFPQRPSAGSQGPRPLRLRARRRRLPCRHFRQRQTGRARPAWNHRHFHYADRRRAA